MIGYAMGIVLVAGAFSTAGIGPGFLALVLWFFFGYFWELPPLIGLLLTLDLWDPKEAIQGFLTSGSVRWSFMGL